MKRRLSTTWAFAWFLAALAAGLRGAKPYDLSRMLHGPSATHWLGFDAFGRDLLELTLRSSLWSAGFALGAVVFACAASAFLGSSIAVAPPRAQFWALRCLEFFLAFPSLLFALMIAAVRGPGWSTLAVALLLSVLPSFVRLVHARAREILSEDYVLAARSLGAAPNHIVLRHLLPAVGEICRVKAPNLFAHALIAEATLSFLGIGAPAGRDTWGSLLAQGRDSLLEAPHVAIATGLPLVLTVLALTVISEREISPKLR